MAKEFDRFALYVTAQIQRGNGYQARAEIASILAGITDPKRLEPHGFKVYSQNEEDGIIEEICRRLGIGGGRFIEVGVGNGLECNSLYLIHKGWRGAWIEGDPKQQPAINATFASIINRQLQLGFGFLNVGNMDDAFARLFADGGEVDLLSIDVDGNDIYLFEAMPIRPKIVVIEYNARFPPGLSKRQVYNPTRLWSGSDYFGASLRAIWEAASAKGYRLVGTNITGSNAFLVRDDLAGDLFADEATPEALYHPARYWLTMDHYSAIGHSPDFGPYVDLEDDGA